MDPGLCYLLYFCSHISSLKLCESCGVCVLKILLYGKMPPPLDAKIDGWGDGQVGVWQQMLLCCVSVPAVAVGPDSMRGCHHFCLCCSRQHGLHQPWPAGKPCTVVSNSYQTQSTDKWNSWTSHTQHGTNNKTPELPTVALVWHANRCKVHTRGIHSTQQTSHAQHGTQQQDTWVT